jgi:hypothetical protein
VNVSSKEQPIVILGGFLAKSYFYRDLKNALSSLSGNPVYICNLGFVEWYRAINAKGWLKIMHKLHSLVENTVSESKTGKITLIGHSSGGVIARLYLAPDEFLGCVFNGKRYVSHLITLGSPHYNLHGTPMRKFVQEKYPDSYFHPEVKYFSVAGTGVLGNKNGNVMERISYHSYRYLCGRGDISGDGLVPIDSALLRGSTHITLEGVGHPFLAARNWYGKTENVSIWWNKVVSDL